MTNNFTKRPVPGELFNLQSIAVVNAAVSWTTWHYLPDDNPVVVMYIRPMVYSDIPREERRLGDWSSAVVENYALCLYENHKIYVEWMHLTQLKAISPQEQP